MTLLDRNRYPCRMADDPATFSICFLQPAHAIHLQSQRYYRLESAMQLLCCQKSASGAPAPDAGAYCVFNIPVVQWLLLGIVDDRNSSQVGYSFRSILERAGEAAYEHGLLARSLVPLRIILKSRVGVNLGNSKLDLNDTQDRCEWVGSARRCLLQWT